MVPCPAAYQSSSPACAPRLSPAPSLSSNETPYGLLRFCQASERAGLPRVVALQNAYSLLCRTFDAALAECCHAEGVGLLAYSPLAMGLLTGKYLAPGGGPREAR